VAGFDDFDRYCADDNVQADDCGEAFARWIAERTGSPAPRFEKVEPGDEQILPEREQRDLDGGHSFPALSRRRERQRRARNAPSG
jgi:hypothetical protein